MDRSEAFLKAKKFSEIVIEKFNPEKIILFGSYAKGTYTNNSDIDVAVLVDKIDGDLLDKKAELFQLRRNIDLTIEPILFIGNEDKSGFLESILSYGEIIYQRPA